MKTGKKSNDENREWAERQLEKTSEAAGEMEEIGTRQLLLQTLREMNCNVEELDNGEILFYFEGGQFMVRAHDDSNYATLFYLFFDDVELYDTERVEKLKRVVNRTNSRLTAQTFYAVDRERGLINVHCSSTFYFRPEIKDKHTYLYAELRDIFNTQHFLCGEMAQDDDCEDED